MSYMVDTIKQYESIRVKVETMAKTSKTVSEAVKTILETKPIERIMTRKGVLTTLVETNAGVLATFDGTEIVEYSAYLKIDNSICLIDARDPDEIVATIIDGVLSIDNIIDTKKTYIIEVDGGEINLSAIATLANTKHILYDTYIPSKSAFYMEKKYKDVFDQLGTTLVDILKDADKKGKYFKIKTYQEFLSSIPITIP